MSLATLSHLFLLSDMLHRQLRAVYKYWAPCRLCFSLRPLVSGSHSFAVLLGSTVDTCYVSLQRLLWVELFELSAMLGSTVALGEDFVAMIVFSAMRGSTVALGDDFLVLVVLSAMLGSTVALGDDWW